MHLVLVQHDALLVRGEEVRVPLVRVDDLDVVELLRREVGAGQLRRGQELVEGALLRDGAHLDPGGILLLVDQVLLARGVVRARHGRGLLPVGALALAEPVVHERVAQPDGVFGLCQNHLGGGDS